MAAWVKLVAAGDGDAPEALSSHDPGNFVVAPFGIVEVIRTPA